MLICHTCPLLQAVQMAHAAAGDDALPELLADDLTTGALTQLQAEVKPDELAAATKNLCLVVLLFSFGLILFVFSSTYHAYYGVLDISFAR